MRRIAFVDRDGTILAEPADFQIDSIRKLKFLPGAIRGLRTLQRELDFELVLVSNQDGLGTERFPYEAFEPPHTLMLDVLASEDVMFDRVCIDTSLPSQGLPTRKPGIAMVEDLTRTLDRASSVVIGDRDTDVAFAKALEIPCIRLTDPMSTPTGPTNVPADVTCTRWDDVVHWIRSRGRRVTIHRVTSETSIQGHLCLDGPPHASISTGIGFYDHMLEQIALHSGISIQLKVYGDLHVDAHHTLEDTAIALGQAIRSALGTKRGIGRYGFVVPMDDACTTLSLDLSDRPFLQWSVPLSGSMIGDLPVPMAEHIFRSLADALRCTLHVNAYGHDDHHILESVFKAFARALRMAIQRVDLALPSSKGVL